MATWPSNFPEPLLEGYGFRPDENVIRTDFEGGAARQRRRFTAIGKRVRATFLFETDALLDAFLAFWRDDIEDGAAWFELDLPLGTGTTTLDVRFVGVYEATPAGAGLWRVSGELETEAL